MILCRFSEAEMVVVLAILLSQYHITVDTERLPDVPGETKLQRRERVLKSTLGITTTPVRVPLVFTRRG